MNASEKLSSEKLSAALDRVSPLHVGLGMGGLSLVVMLTSTCSVLSSDGPLPTPRPAPPPPEDTVVKSARFKKGYYQAQVDDDCKALKIRRVGATTLKQGNPFRVEFSGRQTLKLKGKLDTESLRLRVLRRKLMVGEEGRGIRAPHLVLRIENKTDRFLAYRIETKVLGGESSAKAILGHNAIALKPSEKLTRTESLIRESSRLTITKVELLEVTRLGYHYISRLDPLRLQYSKRTATGHQYQGLRSCKLIPWRTIKNGLRSGTTRWYDVLDFYSRHSCVEYTFFNGYSWSENGPDSLPVRPSKKQP